MKRYEYHLEMITFTTSAERDEKLLKLANQWGHTGWRINQLAVEPRLAVNEQSLKILLEHETEDSEIHAS